MSTKLTNITNQYSKFSDNQVLTKAQLNQFLDYFDDQDRLSRIGLSGVGIVCGFEIKWGNPNASKDFITFRNAEVVTKIDAETDGSTEEVSLLRKNQTGQYVEVSQGIAVTTDGDLLKFTRPISDNSDFRELLSKGVKKKFTHYREYDNNDASYPPFYNNKVQVDLLELAEASEVGNDNRYKPLSEIDISKKVVFLYLESYTKKGDLCTALDCDSQGQAQVRQLKMLLLDNDIAQSIAQNDIIYNKHNWYLFLASVAPLKGKRDIITFLDSQATDLDEIKSIYLKLIADENLKDKLRLGINKVFEKFGKLEISAQLFANLWPSDITKVSGDFQYRYDFLKDVIATYTEIRGLLLKINVECCPLINAFPKHIMLGYVTDEVSDVELRHRFYASPIVGQQEVLLKELNSLIERLYDQLTNYQALSSDAVLKITPSKTQTALGEKAIPAYYKVTNNSLIDHWNYELTQQFAASTNIGYYNNDIPNNTSLEYCFEEYDFLRIEGVQGKVYTRALESLQTLKSQYGLNFDIKVLSLATQDTEININDYDCEFRDLRMLLQAWQSEQNCALKAASELLSGFTTNTAGGNVSSTGNTIAANSGATSATSATDNQLSAEDGSSDVASSNDNNAPFDKELANAFNVLERAGLVQSKGDGSTVSTTKDVPSDREIKKAQEVIKETLGVEALEGGNVSKLGALAGQKVAVDVGKGIPLAKGGFGGKVSIPVFSGKTTKEQVEESIVTEDNTLGQILDEFIQVNPVASPVEIAAGVDAQLQPIFATPAWQGKEDVREVLEVSVDILANIYDYTRIVPETLLELDPIKLAAINTSLENVCGLVDTLKEKYDTADLQPQLKNDISILINQLAGVCCSGEKLELLIAEINGRKAKVLENTVFRNFVTKHPGVRHRAGVPIGGTFIMVYQSESTFDEDIIEPITLRIPFKSIPRHKDQAQLVFINPKLSSSITFLSGKIGIDDRFDGLFGNSKIPVDDKRTILDGFAIEDKEKEAFELEAIDPGKARFLGLGESPKFLVEQRIDIVDDLEEMVAQIARLWNNNWAIAGASKFLNAIAKGTDIFIQVQDIALEKKANYFQVSNPNIIGSKTGRIDFDVNKVIPANPTPSNTVVADFALPYICCSDCAPVNFVLPREEVSLAVNKPQICLTLDDGVFPIANFTVQPKKGEVKALVPANIVEQGGSGVVKNGEVYEFDTATLDPSLYGRPIRFTVNDQSTSASVTVYEALDVQVSIKDPIDYNDKKTIALVTFEVTGNYNANTKFIWNFGNEKGEDKPVNNIVTQRYELQPREGDENPNIFQPTLQVANGPCAYPVTIPELILDEPIPEASLTLGAVPCVDPNDGEEKVSVEIVEVQPPNATIEIRTVDKVVPVGIHLAGDNSEIVINKELFSLYDTDLYFWVDGTSLNSPVLVIPNKNKIAEFVASKSIIRILPGQPVSVDFLITNLTGRQKASGDYSFLWDFGDGKTSEEVLLSKNFDTIHDYNTEKLEEGEHSFTVSLIVKGGPCEEAVYTETITIIVQQKPGKLLECIPESQALIQTTHDEIKKKTEEGDEVKTLVINPTLDLYKKLDQRDNKKDYITYFEGEQNGAVLSIFLGDEFLTSNKEGLLDITFNLIIDRNKEGKPFDDLRKFYLAQLQAFFLVVRCQREDIYVEFEEIILQIVDKIIAHLKEFNLNEIAIDEKQILKKFFTIYLKSDRLNATLKKKIANEIMTLFS